MTREVEPVINDYWTRAEFPHDLLPGLAGLGIAGLTYDGPGCPARGALVNGLVAMELSPRRLLDRHVHGRARRARDGLDHAVRLRGAARALAAGDGPDGADRRVRPHRARHRLGDLAGHVDHAPAATATSGCSTAQKKWIGNATFADLVVIWAKDEDDGEVKGFVVRGDAEGFTATKQEDKIALRVVQNAEIDLVDVRVPEADRLQEATRSPTPRACCG